MLQRALYAGHVVTLRCSFNSLQVRNTHSTSCHRTSGSASRLLKQNLTAATCSPCQGHGGAATKAISEAIVHFYRELDKIHSGRRCQNLCMLIIQRTLLKRYDEFPQDEFLFMLRHGEHILVYVEHFFESRLLKSEIHANYSLCCSCFWLYIGIQHLVVTSKTLFTPTVLLLHSNKTGNLHKANHWDCLKNSTHSQSLSSWWSMETLLEVSCLDSHVQVQSTTPVNPSDYRRQAFMLEDWKKDE